MSLVLNGSGTITGATTLATTVVSPTLTTPVVTTTIGVGGATPSASGAGITFPATQVSSSDANTLDDYEEGTWTPSCSFSSGTLSSYISSGTYTKVGRLVTVQFDIIIISGTSGAGNVTTAGLPFQASSNNTSGNGREYNNTGKTLNCFLPGGQSFINIYYYDNSFCGTNGNRLCGFVTYSV